VFRAAQESLTNATRHQREAALVWTLEEAEHAIRFTARSVGPRREGVISSGTGLEGLRARAEELRGSLRLRAEDDAFVVELELPDPAPDGAA
jgi:signal transduction histidine kinase